MVICPPKTDGGKAFGVVVMYLGIFFLAMPITIIGANFQSLYDLAARSSVEKSKRKSPGRCSIPSYTYN